MKVTKEELRLALMGASRVMISLTRNHKNMDCCNGLCPAYLECQNNTSEKRCTELVVNKLIYMAKDDIKILNSLQ